VLPIYLLELVRWIPPIGVTDALRGVSQWMASIAVTELWQGAAIAIGLALTLRMAPRVSAAHRFVIWTGSFLLLLVLPWLPWFAQLFAPSSTGVGSSSSSHWLQVDMRWAFAITAVWILASMLRAGDLLVHSVRLFRLWKKASPVKGFASSVGLTSVRGRRNFELCTTSELDRPSVIGFFAPRILIPDWLLDRLTPAELEQVVLHEAEHLHRRDDWTNLVQKLCLIVFPLNPALAWIERRLCREREMACDEAVILATKAPRAYAACLASLAERGLRRRAEALSLGAWHRRAELVSRVHSILAQPRLLSPLATRALLGILGCGLIFGSIELARCPQFVTFVPDPLQPLATKTALPVGNPAEATHTSYASENSSARFRVVNTVARTHQPSQQPAFKSATGSTRVHSPVALPVMAKVQEPSEVVPAERRQKHPKENGLPSQPQEWLVLTTWEQVETQTPVGVVSDSGTVENSAPKPVPQSHASITRQVTVTRLILRVAPASSNPNQPSAIPLVRDDWFVFQL